MGLIFEKTCPFFFKGCVGVGLLSTVFFSSSLSLSLSLSVSKHGVARATIKWLGIGFFLFACWLVEADNGHGTT